MVLAINNELDVPVKFVGVGEKIEDLQPFDADAFAAGLLMLQFLMMIRKLRILFSTMKIMQKKKQSKGCKYGFYFSNK